MMRALLAVMALAVMAGCTHNVHRANAEAAYYDAQARASAERSPIVELVAQPGESITLQGVERFAVYAPDDEALAQYHVEHPAWRFMDRLAGSALTAFGIREAAGVLGAAFEASGDKLTAGGNIGDTRTEVDNSVTEIEDRSTGRDRIGGDQVGRDQRVGDNLRDACQGDDCRAGSPGPIDERNIRRNIGNQPAPPPVPDPAPDEPTDSDDG